MNLDEIRRARVVFTRSQVPPALEGDRAAIAGAQRLAASFGPDIVYLATDAIEEGGVLMPADVYETLALEVFGWGRAVVA